MAKQEQPITVLVAASCDHHKIVGHTKLARDCNITDEATPRLYEVVKKRDCALAQLASDL